LDVPDGSFGSKGPHPPICLQTYRSTWLSNEECASEAEVKDHANRTKPPGCVCGYQEIAIESPRETAIGPGIEFPAVLSHGPEQVGFPSPP